MRCLACNKRLTEDEATVKYANSGEYVGLCRRDLVFLGDVEIIERADLKSESDYNISERLDEQIFDDEIED